MGKNQKGFSIVTVLSVVVVVSLVGAAGWYVNQNRNKKIAPQTSNNDQTSSSQQASEPLQLNSSKLPAGWSEELNESGHISLRHNGTSCFVDTLYTTDTAESNAADIDHNKQTVDAIKSKGYAVQETASSVTIITSKGTKQLTAQALQVSGQANPSSQKYAYIARSDSYTQIQLSCPTSNELASAEEALLAVTFTKVD